ncbi:MAG: aspartate kinase [Bacteroidia bacterium]|jgi:aspartate kinase
MQVFKFGGASVKDSAGVRNVCEIIRAHSRPENVIVISAMGKVTNALEQITEAILGKAPNIDLLISQLKEQHYQIALELFPSAKPVLDAIDSLIAEIYWVAEEAQLKNYDYEYDQIVSIGELLSTRIVAAYLNASGIPCEWIDARDLIRTDDSFREGQVDWKITESQIQAKYSKLRTQKPGFLMLTQGFIASTSDNNSITLGREGSDYSASIIAYCLNASEVVIWKDVPGVLNADPRIFPQAELLNEISYYDAIEMTYYGATVIHPKTIKPLQNKNIPLRVKSFLNPLEAGTLIGNTTQRNDKPTFIRKPEQVLVSISPRDFSFIIEENISEIFREIAKRRIKVNLMQNSALNFSLCLNNEKGKIDAFRESLNDRYRVRYNEACELLTIRNYTDELMGSHTSGKNILLEQKSRNTIQLVLQN